jgi:hypothetical protein
MQLPKRLLIRLSTSLSTVNQIRLKGEVVQVPATPANVKQVEELFNKLPKADLTPETRLRLQKLQKGACKVYANAIIQQTTNAELMTAELERKKQSNRQNRECYALGRVLDA